MPNNTIAVPALTRRRFLGTGLAAAVGSTVLLDLVSVAFANAAPVSNRATRLSMVGDSLTYGSAAAQAAAFATVGWADSIIDGYGSRGVRTKIQADRHTGLMAVDAIRVAPGDSTNWVVALGTNDAGIYAASKLEGVVRLMMDHIGDGHRAMWVDVHLPAAPARQAAWNDALAVVMSERPNEMSVFGWAAMAAEHPEWTAGDHVHCTAAGYRARSAAIAAASVSLALAPEYTSTVQERFTDPWTASNMRH
jgi:lysophospholipase L1-like esterase